MSRERSKPLDEEERDLEDALKRIDIKKIPRPSAERQKELKAAARQYMRAEAKMNIRIDPRELQQIRERAAREGLKYQTLVKSILHKYVTGQLVERNTLSPDNLTVEQTPSRR